MMLKRKLIGTIFGERSWSSHSSGANALLSNVERNMFEYPDAASEERLVGSVDF